MIKMMIYLLKMVIFHSKVLVYQRVQGAAPQFETGLFRNSHQFDISTRKPSVSFVMFTNLAIQRGPRRIEWWINRIKQE